MKNSFMNITKEKIINEINNSNDLEYCYQVLYDLNDELKRDKELVYLLNAFYLLS